MNLEKIEKFKKYHEMTRENGIDMPNKDTFDSKIEIAINLWPQINSKGEINYLFGKGVGVELALLGEVKNRTKNNCNFPYRSHSDFEIYNSKSTNYSEISESKDFVSVFGAQEIYPKTYTKGLKNIPDGYMDQTYDTVIYNGNTYLIPELELLFLDKYMKQESTARTMGCDAILLLNEYQLDIEKITDYFEKFVKTPGLEKYDNSIQNDYENAIHKISQLFNNTKNSMLEDDLPITFENVVNEVNEYVNNFRNGSNHKVSINGVSLSLYPQPIEFVEKNGQIDISDANKLEIKKLMVESRINEEDKYNKIIEEIKEQYNKIYPMSKKNN